MKVGDKIYCRENLFLGRELLFIKGVWYEISNFDSKSVQVNSIILNKKFAFFCHNFDTYFLTKKEIRKNKLKKINESI